MTYKETIQLRLTLEKKFYPKLRKGLKTLLLDFIEYLKTGGAVSERLMNVIVTGDKLRDLVNEMYITSGMSFAKVYYKELAQLKEDLTPTWESEMIRYANEMAGIKVVTITATQRIMFLNLFQALTNEAFEQGYGVEKTATYLRRELLRQGVEYQKWMARRIAQTEILGASNRAQSIVANRINDIVKLQKVWSTGGMSKTERHTLIPELNTGEAIPLDQPFRFVNQNGNVVEMMEPGDTSLGAGPEDVVNCKCIVKHVLA